MKFKRVITLALLAVLGWLGISNAVKFSQTYSQQKQSLSQVQGLITEFGDKGKATSLDGLKASQKKLQDLVSVLETIPHLPGMDYDQAQASLNQLRPLLAQTSQRAQVEDQAVADLEAARKLDAEAAGLVQKPPCPPEVWQQAKEKWQQSITLLEKIPTNTWVAAQVKDGLAAVRTNSKIANNNLSVEKDAEKLMGQALEAADLAAKMTQTKPYELSSLSTAKVHWLRAVQFLGAIPMPSHVTQDIRDLYPVFRNNLQSVNSALEQFQQCLKRDSNSEYLCGYDITLNLETPTQLASAEGVDSNSVDSNSDDSSVSEDSLTSDTSTYTSTYLPHRSWSGLSHDRSSSGRTWVHGYTRRDGTSVSGHNRSSGGSRVSGFGSSRIGSASS